MAEAEGGSNLFHGTCTVTHRGLSSRCHSHLPWLCISQRAGRPCNEVPLAWSPSPLWAFVPSFFAQSDQLPTPAAGLMELQREEIAWVSGRYLRDKSLCINPSVVPTLSAVALGVVFLNEGPSAVQRARWSHANVGSDLLIQVHLPPGQPRALGAGSAPVLTAGFHLRIKSRKKNKVLTNFFGLIRTSREEEKNVSSRK